MKNIFSNVSDPAARAAAKQKPRAERLAKLCGADVELGNFITGAAAVGGTGALASRLLLREIHGFPTGARRDGGVTYDDQDWGRKYLKENGGCIYIDLDHLELAQPETLSAFDHVACAQAMLRLARRAQTAANVQSTDGKIIEVLANNSDGQGNSYGSHLNFLITRRAWDELFFSRMHTLLFLASYQASSIVFTGQGKVGSENRAPAVAYQISQRADFFETLSSIETTQRRPIVNSRNEALCGGFRRVVRRKIPALEMARLHVIFYDHTLCPVASLLKVGVMQIVLAMIEAGRVNPELILDHPLAAVQQWSHDPALDACAELIGGQQLTAVELQLRFFAEASAFVADGGCEGFVPRAKEILELWGDTLQKLSRKDFPALTSRVDWILKASLLDRARHQHPDWTWESPELKRLDLMYGSLRNGLYWACERQGVIEPVVSDERIEHFTQQPPEDTRAWTRAMLLRHAQPEEIERVDWDEISFRVRDRDGWPMREQVWLPDPLASGRAENENLFQRAPGLAGVIETLNESSQDLWPATSATATSTAVAIYSNGKEKPI